MGIRVKEMIMKTMTNYVFKNTMNLEADAYYSGVKIDIERFVSVFGNAVAEAKGLGLNVSHSCAVRYDMKEMREVEKLPSDSKVEFEAKKIGFEFGNEALYRVTFRV